MKKLILMMVIFNAILPGIVIGSLTHEKNHTVMAELGAVSWCPHCPPASEKIYNLFQSGELNFYYVTLVYDKNPIAQARGKWLNDAYIPMLYLDGGYKVVNDRNRFEEEIRNTQNRNTRDISVDVSGEWKGKNEIEVEVNISNNEGRPYLGHLRVYVNEINSRWMDEAGYPFHYAFLDFAVNKYILLMPHGKIYIRAKWNATHASHNQNFDGIEKGNIMVIASVSQWLPHIQQNPWDKPVTTRYFVAQFVDDVDGIEI